MKGSKEILVDKLSATHVRPGEDQAHHMLALNLDHSELVKFRADDENYQGSVRGILQEFADAAFQMKSGYQEAAGECKS